MCHILSWIVKIKYYKTFPAMAKIRIMRDYIPLDSHGHNEGIKKPNLHF